MQQQPTKNKEKKGTQTKK